MCKLIYTKRGFNLNKLKRGLASFGIAGALIIGGGTAAHAETWTQGPQKWQHDRVGSYCGVWAYNDYNWWEEVFQGKRDGWEREWWALC
jgi:hypothetical protein